MSDEEREALIQEFEEIGIMTFKQGEDRDSFDAIVEYVRKYAIPTYTDLDKTEGTITISKRPLGSLEFN